MSLKPISAGTLCNEPVILDTEMLIPWHEDGVMESIMQAPPQLQHIPQLPQQPVLDRSLLPHATRGRGRMIVFSDEMTEW